MTARCQGPETNRGLIEIPAFSRCASNSSLRTKTDQRARMARSTGLYRQKNWSPAAPGAPSRPSILCVRPKAAVAASLRAHSACWCVWLSSRRRCCRSRSGGTAKISRRSFLPHGAPLFAPLRVGRDSHLCNGLYLRLIVRNREPILATIYSYSMCKVQARE